MQTVDLASSGGLHSALLEQHGEVGDSVATFVRQYLGSILQPFADHVDELHQVVTQVRADLNQTAHLANTNAGELSDNAVLLQGLRADTDKSNRNIAQLRLDLTTLDEQKAILESDHNRTRELHGKLDDHHRNTLTSLMDLQQEVKATNDSLAQLRLEAADMEQSHVGKLEVTAQHLRSEVDRLGRALQATAQTLKESAKPVDTLRKDFQKLQLGCDRRRKSDDAFFQEVSAALSSLKIAQGNTDHSVKSHDAAIGDLRAASSTSQRRIDSIAKIQTTQERQQKVATEKVADLEEQTKGFRVQLHALSESLGITEENLKMGSLFELVAKLTEAGEQHGKSIRLIERDIEVHTEQLTAADARSTQIDEGMVKLRELSERLDQQMCTRVDALEALLTANEAADQEERDKRESETAARLRDKIEMTKKFEQQVADTAAAFEKNNAEFEKMNVELDGVGFRVHCLEESQTKNENQLSQLNDGLGVTQEYWKGLTQGLKDTHRSIAVDGEMLPQKGTHTTSLPALVNTASPQSCRGNRTAR